MDLMSTTAKDILTLPGHDVQPPHCGEGDGPAATPPNTKRMSRQLSTKQNVVEELETTDQLLDYLVQNGALTASAVNSIREAESGTETNVELLSHLEEGGESSVRLLVSGLRQTGQLYLASLLDDSDRIKALSGSGYLSKSRHKGQVSLQIQVQALRLRPESSLIPSSLVPARGWVSLDDILLQIHSLMQSTLVPEVPPEVTQFEVLDNVEEEEKTKPSCFCGCISKIFGSKHKSEKEAKKKALNNGKKYEVGRSSVDRQSSFRSMPGVEVNPWRKSESFRAGLSEEELHTSLQNLHNAADTLRYKCRQFYTMAGDTSTSLGLGLVRYFEQDRGALVLEFTPTDSHLQITTISMQLQPLRQLANECESGQLLADISNLLVTQQVLDRLGAEGLKLAIKLDEQDLHTAEQELI